MIETLGHYKILDRIGAGGMGEVYRARDTRLGRTVAIKVLKADIAGVRAGGPKIKGPVDVDVKHTVAVVLVDHVPPG